MPDIDYIQLDDKVECPICGNPLERFETKEGPGVRMFIDFRDVDHFHSRCEHCNNLIELSLNKPVEDNLRKELTINDYSKKSRVY